MKGLLFIFILAMFYLTALAQNKEIVSGAQNCSTQKMSFKQLPLSNNNKTTVYHSFDVLNYKFELDLYNCFVEPFLKSFSGKIEITLRAMQPINQIRLNAVNSSLQIDSISKNGAAFIHTNDTLTVSLDKTYQTGDTAVVRISYRHKAVADGAFYVNTGFVFTDCEPQGARCWFPCWDNPLDKATTDLLVRVPTDVLLGSNGSLIDSINTGNEIYYHWKSRDPISTYLIVMSGKVDYQLKIVYWSPASDTTKKIPFRFYYNVGEDVKSISATVLDMCTFYSSIFCEHPFEKNGFATLNSDFGWGGMENQTLTSLCPNCWDINIISHEFAHQWFGDMITCASWADIWMNEGFATYIEALWLEHEQGYAAYKSAIESDAIGYTANNPGWAISNPAWAINPPSINVLFNYPVTYAKGACVLHLLRYVLGDDMFFNVIKSYANSNDFRFKNASINDFAQFVNTVTGQDYSWFFAEWIYTANHPQYNSSYYFRDGGNETWYLDYKIAQIQTNTGFFKMPIELKVRFNDNTDTIVHFVNDINNQLVTFSFKKLPAFVAFDPSDQIVLKSSIQVPIKNNVFPEINIYPNPSDDYIKIDFSSTKIYTINLYDFSGKLLFQTSTQSDSLKINTKGFKSGFYILNIKSKNENFNKKIEILR